MSKALQQELETWLDANWQPERPLREWREMMVEAGWAVPDWPKEYYGRGLGPEETRLISDIMQARKIIHGMTSMGAHHASRTMLAHGSEALKKKFLRPSLTGEISWCQLFSEPGSGSDLAGSTTKAELKDGTWLINGQKVWNTSAHHADYGMLLARSDWDKPKHQGLTYFILDMRQKGVTVRPLKQMNGHASFNEVFIEDAQIPDEDRCGAEGEGWQAALTTLSYEREGFARQRDGVSFKNMRGRIYEEYAEEQKIVLEPYKWYPQRTGRADLALPRARESGALADPVFRQELARLLCLNQSAAYAATLATLRRRQGRAPLNASGAMEKLAASMIARQGSKVHGLISGASAMLGGNESARNGLVAEILLSVPAISIAGGTDEIQKNVISERVLEMPKETRADTGPFRDIRRN